MAHACNPALGYGPWLIPGALAKQLSTCMFTHIYTAHHTHTQKKPEPNKIERDRSSKEPVLDPGLVISVPKSADAGESEVSLPAHGHVAHLVEGLTSIQEAWGTIPNTT